MSDFPQPPDRPSEEPDDPERAMRRDLEAAGVDPNRETTISFLLAFRTEADAQAAAVLAQRERYEALVGDISGPVAGCPPLLELSRESPPWVCLASRRVVPARIQLRAACDWFEALARRFGGVYDGCDLRTGP